MISSDDHGKTWSDRREITPAAERKIGIGMRPGRCTRSSSYAGRTPAGSSSRATTVMERRTRQRTPGDRTSFTATITARLGKLGAVDTHLAADPINPNECVAVELVDGRVYVNSRQHQGSEPAKRVIALQQRWRRVVRCASFAAEPQITSPIVQNSQIRCGKRSGRQRQSACSLRSWRCESTSRSDDAHEPRRSQNMGTEDGDP